MSSNSSSSKAAGDYRTQTDFWEKREDGSLERLGPVGDMHRLQPVTRGWRLTHFPPGLTPDIWHADFFWEAEEDDQLVRFSTFLAEHSLLNTLIERETKAVSKNADGYLAVANWRDENSFTAFLVSPSGKTIGNYSGGINTPVATFVLGQRTIHGSQYMDKEFMGRGLAHLLVDVAEKLTGLPAVPHGHMCTPGTCSEAAWRFWTKRATSRKVPGMPADEMAEARNSAAQEMERRRLATMMPDTPELAAQLARSVGADLIVAEQEGKIGFAWSLLDGRRSSLSGLLNDDAILKHNLNLWGLWTELTGPIEEVRLRRVRNANIDDLGLVLDLVARSTQTPLDPEPDAYQSKIGAAI